jgi:hypothetical protein
VIRDHSLAVADPDPHTGGNCRLGTIRRESPRVPMGPA